MATKASAIQSALYAARRGGIPPKTYAIYRVGSQWMFTPSTKEVVQEKYKIRIKDWTVIWPPKDGHIG